MTDLTRPHDGPTLKIRVVYEGSWMGLGYDCVHVAEQMVAAYNEAHPRSPLVVLDAKWATPEPEWEERGGGW